MLKRKLRRRAQAEPGYAQAVPERFGCYSPKDLGCDGKGQWVWVHAVSLGETRAAALLIKELLNGLVSALFIYPIALVEMHVSDGMLLTDLFQRYSCLIPSITDFN